ncbi:CHRD domain-containing protein [Psychroserpens algicola]|uniref:Superoxide dismutase family protein n=1 Tax=Psychroserpens algicola TaxID=1719034 RepID=A0ABT0HCC8_9FLAO|nr:CHRD domain-containing protein [Psychroserpens algicola]MCK8481991.1 superoxide dismutase family protein [Psychroserpens algicola]
MKTLLKLLLIVPIAFMTSCSNDDDLSSNGNPFVGDTKTYQLESVADPTISGSATFIENENGSTTIELQLSGTPSGGMHPAHIHFNTAAEGGDIALTLGTVDGDTGFSTVTTSELNDATSVTYDELIAFDGYINVHLSADALETLVAQGDIGQNELTGAEKVYALGSVDVPSVSGTATFSERVNGEALATIALDGTADGDMHPGHIHLNTAAEGGAIAFTFNPVIGATGMSKTNVAMLDDSSGFGYDDILAFDGYINIHLSADDLGTLIAQGDIGQNELTGTEKIYALGTADVAGISGTATFSERTNGEALATINLDGAPDGGMHPGHIHFNTAAESGGVAFTFNPVNGTTGVSVTNLAMLDDSTAFGYADILDFDGYINIHLSASELSTIVAQGDIGQNELTGISTVYNLATVDVVGISGTATFSERVNGEALAILTLDGTPDGGMHPAHIHMGSVATAPGGILFTFNSVDGTTGMSMTNVAALDDTTAFGYNDVLTVDGYINVHLSADNLGTLVAQGDIGVNQ